LDHLHQRGVRAEPRAVCAAEAPELGQFRHVAALVGFLRVPVLAGQFVGRGEHACNWCAHPWLSPRSWSAEAGADRRGAAHGGARASMTRQPNDGGAGRSCSPGAGRTRSVYHPPGGAAQGCIGARPRDRATYYIRYIY
jgi:hypothetical protein